MYLDKPSYYTRDGAIDRELQILPGRPIPDPIWNTALGLGFVWQLDIWRQLRNARDAAMRRYVAAREKRNYQVTKTVAEIADLYYRLMALDKRIENLDMTIRLQQKSLEFSNAVKDAGRGTELPVQRFLAEVNRNQSQKLIVRQDIIEAENRINFLLNRYPQPIERSSAGFFDITISAISAGLPSELLDTRPDIRQAAREVEAAGLDIKVARARFYPTLMINAAAGYQAFNPKYLLNTPEAIAANVAGDLVAPLAQLVGQRVHVLGHAAVARVVGLRDDADPHASTRCATPRGAASAADAGSLQNGRKMHHWSRFSRMWRSATCATA